MTLPRPTQAQLTAAIGRTLPDHLRPGLRILFCGINPGTYSAALGHHFARPGNRFWKALHRAGYTRRVLAPEESHLLLARGYGLTDIVARATARAEELGAEELIKGAGKLRQKVRRYQPRWLAILGITAYRQAFEHPQAILGPQPESIGRTRIWVLPNPSGLNAHHQPAILAAAMRTLRIAASRRPRVRA